MKNDKLCTRIPSIKELSSIKESCILNEVSWHMERNKLWFAFDTCLFIKWPTHMEGAEDSTSVGLEKVAL